MRVNQKIIVDIASGRVLERQADEYYGPVVLAGGGGDNQKSVTEQSLPDWLVPYAEGFIGSYGNAAFQPGWNPSDPGSMRPIGMPSDLTLQTAGFSPEQETAFQNMSGITPYAQNLAGTGYGNAQNTLSGAYLDPNSNPWLQSTYNQAARSLTDNYSLATAPSIMAQAQRAGQFGSSAMNEAMAYSRYGLGENLANLGTDIYGGNYANERNRQLQMMGMLPQTIGAMYEPQEYLAGVGAQRQGQTQAEMDTAYANAANRAEWPFNILSGFGSAIGQAAGGGGRSTTRTTGGGGGMSVLCSELHRQGLMDDKTYAADAAFGRSLSQEVIAGYHFWAIPVANLMRRSSVFTRLVAPFILSWAQTMRAMVEGRPGDETRLGRILLRYGVPFCAYLGRIRLQWVVEAT